MEFKVVFFTSFMFISMGICSGAKFQCPNSNPCILIDLDAKINIVKVGGVFNETASLDISQATVVNDECLCGSLTQHSIMFKFFPSAEKLRFLFTPMDPFRSNIIQMGAIFDFTPSMHFKDVKDSRTFELSSPSDTKIGDNENSYKCNADQFMEFSYYSHDKTQYYINMDVSHLHVQAYGVKNGKFSKSVIECAADFIVTTEESDTTVTPEPVTSHKPMTTTHGSMTSHKTTMTSPEPMTTEPHTSEHTSVTPEPMTSEPHTSEHTTVIPEPKTSQQHTTTTTPEMTTHHKTTITTEPPHHVTTEPANETTVNPVTTPHTPSTTSLKPIPVVPMYGLKDPDDQYYCIVLQGDMILDLPYETKNSHSEIRVVVPRNATVTGSCSVNGTNNTQAITLNFFEGWSITILIGYFPQTAQTDAHLKYYVEEMDLNYVIDGHFVDPKEEGKNVTVITNPLASQFQADDKGSYKCNSRQSVNFGGRKLYFENLQYLAFGASDTETFPKQDVTECPQDTPKTTLSPSTTPKPSHNKAGAIVGGVVGGIALVVIVLGVVMYFRKQKMKNTQYDEL